MRVSYRTGSSLLLQYIVSTALYIFFICFGVLESPVTVVVAAVFPLAIIMLGFSQRLRKNCTVFLPPTAEDATPITVDGTCAQPFALPVSYKVEIRNLLVLAIAPLFSFLVWFAVATGILHRSEENPVPLYGTMAALFCTSWLSVRWLRERSLLHSGGCTLARIHATTKSRTSFEYYDARAMRRGGSARTFAPVPDSGSHVPILLNMDNPDDAMIFASFFFHQFRLADNHIPDGRLVKVDPEQ